MTAEMATILNIDDQEPGRYARRRMLERAGYTRHRCELRGGCLARA